MYRSTATGWLKHFDFMLLDLLCLQISFLLAFIIRHGWYNPYERELYRDMALFLILADLCVMFFFNSYKNVLKRGAYREMKEMVKQMVMVELLASLFLFSTQSGGSYSRIVLFVMLPVYLILSYSVRQLWKLLLKQIKKNSSGRRRLFVVTDFENVESVIQSILHNGYNTFVIVGIAITDRSMVGEKIGEIPVLADESSVAEYIGSQWVDEVLIAYKKGESCPEQLYEDILKTGATVHLKIAERHSIAGRCEMIERVGEYTVLTTTMKRISFKQTVYKRVLDIVGGLAGCLITLILIIIIGPVIYFSSPGPIFFSQTRIGRSGKRFQMYKFRSMYPDAELRKTELLKQNKSKDGFMFKMDFDPRVIGNRVLQDGRQKTGIGDFIRRTSLDEFPQFFNVLKGDMSLVGTRPPTVDEWEKYELHHRARLATKPGITGMWQISGRSNVMDFEEVVKLDTMYINEWDFGKDIKILLKTFGIVMRREGAK